MSKVTRDSKIRIYVAFLLVVVLISILALRTAWIMIVKADEYSDRAIAQQTSDIPIEAQRGKIYDRNGKELATSATCYHVWIRPDEFRKAYPKEKRQKVLQKLADVLGKDPKKLRKAIRSGGPIVQIAKYLDKQTLDRLTALDITGIETSKGTRRYYPLGTSAAHLLGSVSDENEGRSGVELQFNSYLSGIPGRWVKDTDAAGDTLSYGSKKYYRAQDGYNVVLTIDEMLQHYAEQVISEGMKSTGAERISILVMDPKTGDILAMATTPTFDPNDATEPLEGSEREKFEELSSSAQTKYLSSMWRNPLLSDLYEPGSTFKLITTSAALEEGVTTPKNKYRCVGYVDVNGTRIRCTAVHGDQTLMQAVGNSCNPVQVGLALSMGKKTYYNYLEMFGLTDITHVDLPGEAKPLIQNQNAISNIELATMSFGHGVAVTPISLLTAVNAIGNDGIVMKPRIVTKMTDSNGKVVQTYKPVRAHQIMSEKTASEMKDIMEYVVENGGGGKAKIAGYRIGGKTGTANKAFNGQYTSETWASFVGMAPMDDPQFTVLCVVDHPTKSIYGGTMAAPIVRSFLEKALNYRGIKPNYTQNEAESQGESSVQVPKVTGMNSVEAKAALAKAGLEVQSVPDSALNRSGGFKVVDQYPKAGEVVDKGSTVYLYEK